MPTAPTVSCTHCGQAIPEEGSGGLCAFCIGRNLFASAPSADEALEESLAMGGYALGPEIGCGAMGRIFRARHVALGRDVALKLIHGGAWAGEQELARFRAEAALVARLDHPHIVPIFEVGEAEGMHFFSMKLVEGGSLAARMSEFSRPRDLAGQRRIAELVAKISRAVQYAHERGVLHRDLKPGNILLGEHDEPLVADFGLARQLDSTPGSLTLGSPLGTPAYMAPEQARGGAATTTAADVHALGAVLYELLCGQPPYQAESSSATLALVLAGDPPAAVRTLAPATARDLATICEHCIEREPADRYTSARALADDLDRWLGGEPIRARRVHWPERAVKWARRRPALAAVSGAALALAVTGFAFWLNATAARQREDAVKKIADELHRTQRELGTLMRGSGNVGQRFRALEVFGRLARSGAVTADLRSEAIASLCLPDFRELSAYDPKLATTNVGIDAAHEQTAIGWTWGDLSGQIHLQSAGAMKVLRPPDLGIAGWLQFSPDGRWFAARGGAEMAWWRVESGELIARVPCALGGIAQRGAAFSPDGKRLAHVDGAGKAMIRSAETGALLSEFTPDALPHELRFTRDGNRLAILTRTGLEIWKAGSDAPPELIVKAPHPDPRWLSWDGAGERLVTLNGDRGITLWDAATLTSRIMHGPWDSVLIHYVEFHPSGRYVLTSSDFGETRLWDALVDRQVLRADGYRALNVSADGQRFGFHLRPYRGPAAIMEFAAADEFRAVPLGVGEKARLDVIGDVLRAHDEMGARWFDLAKNREQTPDASAAILGESAQPRTRTRAGDFEAALAVPDRIALRSQPSGILLAHFAAPTPEPLAGVCFSRDGRWLIALTKKGDAHLWNLPLLRAGLRAVGMDW